MLESRFKEKTKIMQQAGFVHRTKKLKPNAQKCTFNTPTMVMDHADAINIVNQAFKKWQPKTKQKAEEIFNLLAKEYADDFQPDVVWDTSSHLSTRDFFVWGHDHDFGFGFISFLLVIFLGGL